MINREITYSIIIPHKNIPELLQRCLDSIPRREDVQIIVVDDNSDTDKVDFEHFPGLGDPFIEIAFTKEGKGAGYARNIGLTKAVGKWLLFADADDYFTDGFMDYIDKYKEFDYDLIYFGVLYKDIKNKKEPIGGKINSKAIFAAIESNNFEEYIYTSFVAIAPWGKIIKLNLIKKNSILFDETFVANDRMFSVKTSYHSKQTFIDSYKIYVREIRDGSLSRIKTKKAIYERLYVYLRVNEYLKNIKKIKYKKNVLPFLIRLISIHDMSYFFKAIKLVKEYNVNLFIEISNFILLKVFHINNKIKELK